MKKLEQMKVYHDLLWACKWDRGLDKLFQDEEFMEKFARFQETEYYNKWIQTPEYQQFLQWNS